MKNRWLALGLVIGVSAILFRFSFGSRERQFDSGPKRSEKVETQSRNVSSNLSRNNLWNSKTEFQELKENILSLLQSENPADINRVYNVLLPALVRMDPKAAAEFSQSAEAGKWRSDLMM